MANCIIFSLLSITTIFSQTTSEPTRQNCDDELQADILIAVDTSCYMTVSECVEQQVLVSQVFTALRGFTTRILTGRSMFNQRIAYIEFDSDSTLFKPFDEGHTLNMFYDSYNNGNSQKPIYSTAEAATITTEYYESVRDRSDTICTESEINARAGDPNLHGLLTEALGTSGMFRLGNSDSLNQRKYILIFSNCGVIDSEIPSLCNEFEGKINQVPSYPYIVNMINLRPSVQSETDPYYIVQPNEYISCLVACDNNGRIFADTLSNIDMDTIIDSIQNSLCTQLLPIQTCAPTTTSEPTTTTTIIAETTVTTDYTTSQTTELTTTELTTTEHSTTAEPTTTGKASTAEQTTLESTTTVHVLCGDNKNSGPGKEIQCTSDEDCCDGFSCRTKDGPKKGKCGRDKNKIRKHRDSSDSKRQKYKKRKYSSKKYDSSSDPTIERDNALVNDKQESVSSSSVGNDADNNNIPWILLFIAVCIISCFACLMLICLMLVCYKHTSVNKKNYDSINDKNKNDKVSIVYE